MTLRLIALFVCWASPTVFAETQSIGKAQYVVVIVWDGMRPDFVSERHTPTLWKLAREGVIFRHHHSSYLSATVVNGAAIATGCYPSTTGLFANYIFWPEIEPTRMVDAGLPAVVQKGDTITGGKYLGRPTVAEILHRSGKRTAIAGSKYVTLLHDRRADAPNPAAEKSFIFFQGATLPNEMINILDKGLRKFPGLDNPGADDWTTSALTRAMWKDGLPPYSLLWLAEPDYTEHKSAPGSPASVLAVEKSDKQLAKVISALDEKHARDKTDIFIVSDHGFSTIERSVDVVAQLNRDGFRAVKEFAAPPQNGEIMIVGNGGSVLFYVIGHDGDVTRRLVTWLEQSDFAGVIFTREKMDGTFPLALAGIDAPHIPDVVMAFRWNERPNEFGAPGMIDADWNRKPGAGTHATLSRFDMHNTLIAAGPDFRPGMLDELPSGNIDLAPTILHILEVAPREKMDGRILSEALIDGKTGEAQTQTEVASRQLGSTTWRQYLKISRVGSAVYIDEGNRSLDADR